MKKKIGIIFVCIIVLAFSVIGSCLNKKLSCYYGHLNQGEGIFMILKLEMTEKNQVKYLYCISDEAIISKDNGLANKLRVIFTEKITKNDSEKIQKAFNKFRSTQFTVLKTKVKNNELMFVTERKKIEPDYDVNVEFKGKIDQNRIYGEMKMNDFKELKNPYYGIAGFYK